MKTVNPFPPAPSPGIDEPRRSYDPIDPDMGRRVRMLASEAAAAAPGRRWRILAQAMAAAGVMSLLATAPRFGADPVADVRLRLLGAAALIVAAIAACVAREDRALAEEEAADRTCPGCGCSQGNACLTTMGSGCWWTPDSYLCSCCQEPAQRVRGPIGGRL